jgi:hypothetical protein
MMSKFIQCIYTVNATAMKVTWQFTHYLLCGWYDYKQWRNWHVKRSDLHIDIFFLIDWYSEIQNYF